MSSHFLKQLHVLKCGVTRSLILMKITIMCVYVFRFIIRWFVYSALHWVPTYRKETTPSKTFCQCIHIPENFGMYSTWSELYCRRLFCVNPHHVLRIKWWKYRVHYDIRFQFWCSLNFLITQQQMVIKNCKVVDGRMPWCLRTSWYLCWSSSWT